MRKAGFWWTMMLGCWAARAGAQQPEVDPREQASESMDEVDPAGMDESATSDATGPAVDPTDPGPLTDVPDTYRDDWAWQKIGPRRAGPMSDVAWYPGEESMIVAVELDGEAWLSVDGGVGWVTILPPLKTDLGSSSRDEDLLLRVETRTEELMADLDEVDDLEVESEEELEELEEEAAEAAREAGDQALADVLAETTDPWMTDMERVLSGELDAPRPRVWFLEDGTIAIGRADGLHVSFDYGDAWRTVLDVPVNALVELSDRGLWVAGTGDGIRWATDLQAWIDVEDGTEGLFVHDLSVGEEGVYAGTKNGVWFAPDAQSWRQVGDGALTVVSVVTDSHWESGIGFSTPDNVFRSDDGGDSYRPMFGAPIRGVVDMLEVARGHLLVSSADGPWESVDGGTTFVPLARGLTDPDVRALAWSDQGVLLVGDEGVLRMEPVRPSDDLPTPDRSKAWSFDPDVPLGPLMDVALGISAKVGAGTGRTRRFLATALPRLIVEGRYNPDSGLQYYDSSGTSRDLGAELRVLATLEWRPEGRKTSDTVWVLVGENDVAVDDGQNQSMLMARVNRNSISDRMRRAQDLSEVYTARLELITRRPSLTTASVLEKVELELAIDQAEAFLDLFTDGAFSRHLAMNHGETP